MKAPHRLSRDRDIRHALRTRLDQRHASDGDAVVVEELPVARGGSRVDVAVINGRIEGFEIKSGLDSLERLHRQVELSSPAMERATLVAAPEHISEALRILPPWWSIVSAEIGACGGVRFKRFRPGRLNPSRCTRAFIDLLERQEIVSMLAMHGLDRGMRSAALFELADHAMRYISPQEIFLDVRRLLKIRAFLEARFSATRFGSTALGGGITSDLPAFMPARLER